MTGIPRRRRCREAKRGDFIAITFEGLTYILAMLYSRYASPILMYLFLSTQIYPSELLIGHLLPFSSSL
jgi:hypothetical protein